MQILDLLFGKPLPTSEERAEHIGPAAGIPIFGLDALSSAAYGPEAALTLLIPAGLAGIHYILPITGAIWRCSSSSTFPTRKPSRPIRAAEARSPLPGRILAIAQVCSRLPRS